MSNKYHPKMTFFAGKYEWRNWPAFKNFKWLVADQGSRLLVGVIIGAWIARYLGKTDFGLLNYALALVTIFSSIPRLGMEGLVVREIIRDQTQAGRWLGTVMAFRGATACVCSLLCLLLIGFLRPGQALPLAIVAVLGIGLVGQSMESGELFFQARNEMRHLVLPRLGLFLAINAVKVVLVIRGMSVFWFAVLTALEQVAGGCLTWVLLRTALGRESRLQFDFWRGWGVLRNAWPLAVAAFSVVVYMKIGQLMLSQMMGDAALGIYSAAIRIPESANFLPMVLASSMLPGLVRNQEMGSEVYQKSLLRYFRINALLSYAVCLPMCLGSSWIIGVLFHAEYSEAAPVMAVYAWSLLFVFTGVSRGQHLLNVCSTRLSLGFSLSGLAINLLANLLFIPRMGAMGVAVATVLSYACSGFLVTFCVPATRRIAQLQGVALLTPWLAFQR